MIIFIWKKKQLNQSLYVVLLSIEFFYKKNLSNFYKKNMKKFVGPAHRAIVGHCLLGWAAGRALGLNGPTHPTIYKC
jgi:hypothetical protein